MGPVGLIYRSHVGNEVHAPALKQENAHSLKAFSSPGGGTTSIIITSFHLVVKYQHRQGPYSESIHRWDGGQSVPELFLEVNLASV